MLTAGISFLSHEKTIAAKKVTIDGKIPPFQTKFEQAIEILPEIAAAFPGTPLLIVTDSWFGNDGLLRPMRKTVGQHSHMLSRLRVNTTLFALPPEHQKHQPGRSGKYGDKMGNATTLASEFHERATTSSINLYGKQRDVLAFDDIMMLKTLKCAVRVVWIYRRSQWIALFTTDLDLTIEQIIEYYGARWKIEAGFKEIKQEIGSSKSQARNCHAVTNLLNFCMMVATITWISADHFDKTPQRCYAVNNRRHFAFSDVRKLITQAALNRGFVSFCPKPDKPIQNSFIDALLRMVA